MLSEICSRTPSYHVFDLVPGSKLQAVWPRKDFQKTCIHSQGAESVLDSGLATVTYAVLSHEVCISGSLVRGPAQVYHDQFQEPATSSTSVFSYAFLQVCACLEGCHIHKSCLSIWKYSWVFVFQVGKKLQGRSSKRCEWIKMCLCSYYTCELWLGLVLL